MKRLTLGKFCLFLVFFGLVFPGLSGASQGAAGAFLRMGLGAKAMAMGDAFVAGGNDGFAGFYNPALLPSLVGRWIALSYRFLALDRRFMYLGYASPLKPTAGLAIGWISSGIGDVGGYDFEGNYYGDLTAGEDAFYFSFANKFGDRVSVGLSAKVVRHRLDEVTARGFGLDFGGLIQVWSGLWIGGQVKDVRTQYSWDTSDYWEHGMSKVDHFPRVQRYGLCYRFSGSRMVMADVEAQDGEVAYHLGGEVGFVLNPTALFVLRGGYDDGKPTLGFGYSFSLYRASSVLDYAFVLEDVAPAGSQIISWSFLF
ncbi:hypothetical protein ISS37_02260 [candidate division KSB1 bacterium]|nr:hypothetical protein [candidate division KSB1 bacterium]